MRSRDQSPVRSATADTRPVRAGMESLIELPQGLSLKAGQEILPEGLEESFSLSPSPRFARTRMYHGYPEGGANVFKVFAAKRRSMVHVKFARQASPSVSESLTHGLTGSGDDNAVASTIAHGCRMTSE